MYKLKGTGVKQLCGPQCKKNWWNCGYYILRPENPEFSNIVPLNATYLPIWSYSVCYFSETAIAIKWEAKMIPGWSHITQCIDY